MDKKLPLQGIKVVTFAQALSGPYCGLLCRAAGAQVIKIEPEYGDSSRGWGKRLDFGRLSSYFLSLNRGKQSIILNLKDESERKQAIQLCREADVIITNSVPGKLQKYGIDNRLFRLKKNLILCAISGFGQKGARLPAYDLILQGLTGLQDITGHSVPTKIGLPIIDLVTGQFAFMRILLALQQQGGHHFVDVSMFDSAMALYSHEASKYLLTGKEPQRSGNHNSSICPYGSFKAKDGLFNLGAGTEAHWRALCNVIDKPDLIENENFSNNSKRLSNKEELISLLNDIFSERPVAFWVESLSKHGVPAAPVLPLNQVLDSFRDRLPMIEYGDQKFPHLPFVEYALGMPPITEPCPCLKID